MQGLLLILLLLIPIVPFLIVDTALIQQGFDPDRTWPFSIGIAICIDVLVVVAVVRLKRSNDSWRKVQQDAERDRQDEVVRKAIEDFLDSNPHYEVTLLRLRDRLIYVDEFRDQRRERWDKALEDFVRDKMSDVYGIGSYIENDLVALVASRVEEIIDRRKELAGEADQSVTVEGHEDPTDFEEACRRLFEAHGFNASRIGGTGDQGADVIAFSSGLRIAVQCKRHSSPVGNQAVQQAEAARQFYDCSVAMVVGTSGYTTSARQLAGKLGVILADATELPDAIQRLVATQQPSMT
jgi:hypothetical protein